jgi:DNA mismatch repair protein MutL
VDVNVHPRKMEARFGDEAGLRRQVEAAVEDALLDHGLVRSNAPRGRSAPDEATVEPDSTAPDGSAGVEMNEPATASPDGTADGDADLTEYAETDAAGHPERDGRERDVQADAPPSGESVSGPAEPGPGTDSAGSNDAGSSGAESSAVEDALAVDRGSTSEDASATERASTGESTPATGSSSGGGPSAADDVDSSASAGPATPAETPATDGTAGDETEMAEDASTADASATAPAGADAATPSKFGGDTDQRTLTGESVDHTREYDSLPPMRVLGQFSDTYVVAETETGLALVDQHAADERVNYERLREAFAGDTTAQSLAEPVDLELTAGEAALFEEYADALASLGFYATRADDRTVEVTTVPAVFDETLDPARLRDVLASFVSTADDASGRATVESLADEFIADLACYPSVTGNTSLTEGAVTELLSALDDCENPYACPHGRPVVVELDEDDIAERFERDYPGHGGRRET